jgi:hypothetical protein
MSPLGMTRYGRGKEKAMDELYVTWEENLKQLLNCKVAMIEVDCHKVGENMWIGHGRGRGAVCRLPRARTTVSLSSYERRT